MRKTVHLVMAIVLMLSTIPHEAFASTLDKDATPVPVVSEGSFTCDTWIHTRMDSFSLAGCELQEASWVFSQGYVGYNLTGTFMPEEEVSLDIKGTMGEMGYQMEHKGNDLFIYIKCYDLFGNEIKEVTKTVQVDDSFSPSLSDSVSVKVPGNASRVEVYGSFSCSWRTPFSAASEMVTIKASLTRSKEADTTKSPVNTNSGTAKPTASPRPDEAYAILGDAWGEVNVRPNSEDDDAYIFAETGMYLYHDDRIKTLTRSGAIISFSDMSTFVMKEDTTIVLDIANERVSKIGLLAGTMWSNFKKLVKDGSMEVEMGQAVAGIKGTTFVCEEKNGVSSLKVFEGTVLFTSLADGKSVQVKDGQQVQADKNGLGEVTDFDIEKELSEWDEKVKEWTEQAIDRSNQSSTMILVIILLSLVAVFVLWVYFSRKKKKNTMEKGLQTTNEADSLEPKFCTQCGATLDKGSRFCIKCGYKIQESDSNKN